MNLFFDLVFVLTILALIIINFRTMLLPNAITFPGFIVAFWVRIFLVVISENGFGTKTPQVFSSLIFDTIFDCLIGAIIGFTTLWLFNRVWYQMRQFEVIGFGDMKMMAMIGVYLGIFNTIGVLFLGAILITICIVLIEAVAKRKFISLPSGFIWGLPAIFFTLISAGQIISLISK